MGTSEEVIDSNSQIPIPIDCIGVVGVYVMVGDKIKPMYRSDKINPTPDAGAYPVVPVRPMDMSPFLNPYFAGRDYERGLLWEDWYREIDEENKIRFDNRYKGEKVLIIYITKAKILSYSSIIPEIAEGALFEFIVWQWSRFHPENRFDHRLNRKEYYNERRKLRARKFKLNVNDYIRQIRTRNT
jgi:hypothetical protein